MRGKLIEDLKVQQVHSASAFTATAMTFGSGSIDTQGYKEMLVVVNLGDILSTTTLACKLYENSADDFTTAVPVTGGVLLSAGTSTTDQTQLLGNVLTTQRKRYMWVGAMSSGGSAASETSSAHIGVDVILGKGTSNPQTQTTTIDLE